MKTVLSILLAGFALAYSGASLAGNTEAGKSKGSFSNGCHGANGLGLLKYIGVRGGNHENGSIVL